MASCGCVPGIKDCSGNVINVFGGKMTTFMALARKVAMRADNYFGGSREAREPVFASALESAA